MRDVCAYVGWVIIEGSTGYSLCRSDSVQNFYSIRYLNDNKTLIDKFDSLGKTNPPINQKKYSHYFLRTAHRFIGVGWGGEFSVGDVYLLLKNLLHFHQYIGIFQFNPSSAHTPLKSQHRLHQREGYWDVHRQPSLIIVLINPIFLRKVNFVLIFFIDRFLQWWLSQIWGDLIRSSGPIDQHHFFNILHFLP